MAWLRIASHFFPPSSRFRRRPTLGASVRCGTEVVAASVTDGGHHVKVCFSTAYNNPANWQSGKCNGKYQIRKRHSGIIGAVLNVLARRRVKCQIGAKANPATIRENHRPGFHVNSKLRSFGEISPIDSRSLFECDWRNASLGLAAIIIKSPIASHPCLLYTSDAADDL